MNELQFAGARWWKFDFHTHTPASDFRDPVTHESWLKAFMEKEIDCVAITDHNSGEWIDDLKRTLEEIEENKPDWYQPLYLFPGVEISANDGVHILAIFGRDKDESHIDQLLGAVDYSGTKGKSDAVTSKSTTEVVNEITKRGGIPIPAHADKKKGLFRQLQGLTLEQVLENEHIYATELRDHSYQKPQLYKDKKVEWTEVNGSDTHSFSDDTFGIFTWIKMEEPSIDGLKLALLDGDCSVNHDMQDDPNRPPEYFIEELEISEAKHIGCSKPLKCHFNQSLNAIIGGRGSGKSTLLEFMRLVLRRDKEIPVSLKDDIRQYSNVGDDNLLIEDSKISLIYRKGEVRYRLNWAHESDCPSLEEEKDGNWTICPGEIRSLFPVRIYSQKQVFELAKDPSALIDIIDEAPKVNSVTIKERHTELVNQYKQIEGKQQELNEKITQENRLRGELNDLTRQIQQIEKSGHQAVLQNYSKRQQQLNEFAIVENEWKGMSCQLVEMQNRIAPVDFNEQHFSEHTDILSDLRAKNEQWQSISDKLSQLAREAQSIIDNWHTEKNAADWMQMLKADIEQYESLSTQLEQQNIDPAEYPRLLMRKKNTQKKLNLISEYQAHQEELKAKKREVFRKIEENRKTLSEKRQKFLTGVLQDNPAISIKIKPFGEDWDGIEEEIRNILQCPDHFSGDIEALRDMYYENGDDGIEKLKKVVKAILDGEKDAKDSRFTSHLEKLPKESMIDLILWFPRDDLKITFGPKNQRIEQGSPGQKTAALLAFILSYGDEPLLLDQPEDDLDNELIYDLIVRQLRETKSKRQVIVVTHNANIVVNGDAEMVFPLEVKGRETHLRRYASVQIKEVREAICDILEGGQHAFEQRYKRINLGD